MFGTRKLRREIVVLMDENERLRKEISEAKYESDKHVKYCNQLADELQSATIKLETATKKLDGVEIKLRKQNESDLMFESVKIIASLLKGKEKDVSKSVELQQKFLAVQAAFNKTREVFEAVRGSGPLTTGESLLGIRK